MLPPHISQNAKDTFIREASKIASLKHDHIIETSYFGVENDNPYIVMEYTPNGTLRQRHPVGSHLKPEEIVKYVQQVADALQCTHSNGLFHCNMRPENILIGENDKVMLSDFGTAIVFQSLRIPLQNAVATLLYIAPEQLGRDGKPCFASDQYSLAVVVYEWICGVPPFQDSQDRLSHHHRKSPPPSLTEFVPDLPKKVQEVVIKGLAKRPADRYPSMQDFARDLEEAFHPQANQPVGAHPPQHTVTLSLLDEKPAAPDQNMNQGSQASPQQRIVLGPDQEPTVPDSDMNQGSQVPPQQLNVFGQGHQPGTPPGRQRFAGGPGGPGVGAGAGPQVPPQSPLPPVAKKNRRTGISSLLSAAILSLIVIMAIAASFVNGIFTFHNPFLHATPTPHPSPTTTNPSPTATPVIASFPNSAIPTNQTTWGTTAPPAMAFFKGKYYLAFIARNGSYTITVCSSSDGKNWPPKNCEALHEASEVAPALIVFKEELFLAFIANDPTQRILITHYDGITRYEDGYWSPNQSLSDEEASEFAPALAVFHDQLYLAFVDKNTNDQSLEFTSWDGINYWSKPQKIDETSSSAPALAASSNTLLIAFIARNPDHTILVAQFDNSSKRWLHNFSVDQQSAVSPSLAFFENHFYLAFLNSANALSLLYSQSPQGSDSSDWHSNPNIFEQSDIAPSLYPQDHLYLAFVTADGTIWIDQSD